MRIKKVLFFLILVFAAFNLSAQGVDKYGNIVTDIRFFTDKFGVVGSLNAVDRFGKLIYSPDQVVTIIQKAANTTVYKYTYNVRAYTESYNFIRILGGIGNVVFSS